MARQGGTLRIDCASMDDTALVAAVRHGDRDAFREIMRRCNQRLFRVARGVVNDDAEAEDVVQEAYAHAFEKLPTFRGDAALLTWLTRIVLNEAHGRLRQRRFVVDVEQIEASQMDSASIVPFNQAGVPGPEMLNLMKLGVVPFGTALLSQISNDHPELGAPDLAGLNPDMPSLRRTSVLT